MALPSQPAWFGLAWLGFDNFLSALYRQIKNIATADLTLSLLLATKHLCELYNYYY